MTLKQYLLITTSDAQFQGDNLLESYVLQVVIPLKQII